MTDSTPPPALSHFDPQGQAWMVDVGHKASSRRSAVAGGRIGMSAAAFASLSGAQTSPKGDVLGVARIAAIQGAKQTSSLIPLCHPLPLDHVKVAFDLDAHNHRVAIEVTVQTEGRTGVEMEALSAAAVGLLTIYDMLKAIDKGMVIEEIALLSKHGGKSGPWLRDAPQPAA